MRRKRVTLLYVILGVFAAAFFVFGSNVQAYQIAENMEIAGYVENRTGIRLDDHLGYALGLNQNEEGDFSMMRTTVLFDFDWRINDNLKFKAIARGSYDAVYALNDNYDSTTPGPDPKDGEYFPGPTDLSTEADMDWNFAPREYYLTLKMGNLYIKAGRMQIFWGESDFLRMADIINPLDLSWDWSFPAWENIRIPLHMIDVVYWIPHFYNMGIELLWVPADFRPAQTAPFGANWDPILPPDPLFSLIRNQMEHDLPDRDLDNGQGGVKIMGRVGELDFSVFGYYQRIQEVAGLPIAVFSVGPGVVDPLNFPFQYRWPHIMNIGGSFNYYCPWLKTVLRGEMAYVPDKPFTKNPQPGGITFETTAAEEDVFSFFLGFDGDYWLRFLNPNKTISVTGQWFQSFVLGDGAYRLLTGYGDDGQADGQTILSFATWTEYMEGYLKPVVAAVHSFTEECGFVDYNLTYAPTYEWSFTLGHRIIYGNELNTGIWGVVRANDEVYFKIKRNF